MQSGLSWLIVLRKRESMRTAYDGFDPETLAAWTAADVERTLLDPGVIRNRRKVESVVVNARIALELPGGLAGWIDQRAPAPRPRPARLADIAPTSPQSAAMAKELHREGMRFVGPTTLHALLQAGGWVDDHLDDCETAG
jgi:DNA-3-methyladenine glycosylase I